MVYVLQIDGGITSEFGCGYAILEWSERPGKKCERHPVLAEGYRAVLVCDTWVRVLSVRVSCQLD